MPRRGCCWFTCLLLWFAAGASAAEPLTLPVWEDGPPGDPDATPTLTVYRPAQPNGTALLICPGGGYGGLAIQPEGHGIARWLNRHDIVGVVLKYRLPRGRSQAPLSDALRAMRIIRQRAADWGVDRSRVGVIGFSAGGHLASTVATQFTKPDPEAADPLARFSSRPDFAILIYPVITMGEHTHGGSRRNLLGPNATPEQIRAMSSELRVTRETPPCFLAHAVDDKPVPPINSQLFHRALQAKKIPAKYLELPDGGHGLSGYKGPSWDAWQRQSLAWIEKTLAQREDAP